MSSGPSNAFGRQQAPAKPGAQLPVRSFFVEPDCDHVARLRNVWGLLGWYHRTVVAPQLTIRGQLKRLWWRLTGQRWKLMSPWEQLEARIQLAHQRLEADADAARQAEGADA